MKIRGIVDPRSDAYGRLKGGAWMLSFRLHPWRDGDGRLIDGDAIVWQSWDTEEALKTARASMPPEGAVVEVVGEAPDWIPGLESRARAPHELVLTGWSAVDDPELSMFAASLAPPAEITHGVLGRFTFDPKLRSYACRRALPTGATYRVHVTPLDPRSVAPAIEHVRPMVEWVESRLADVRTSVADQLWELWDDAWRQDDEEDVDRDAFERALSLQSLEWDEERGPSELSLSFDDGDLFGGHGISVEVSDYVVRSATLYG